MSSIHSRPGDKIVPAKLALNEIEEKLQKLVHLEAMKKFDKKTQQDVKRDLDAIIGSGDEIVEDDLMKNLKKSLKSRVEDTV